MLVARMEQMVRVQVGYAEEDGKILVQKAVAEKDDEIQQLRRQISEFVRGMRGALNFVYCPGAADVQRMRDELELLRERCEASAHWETEVLKLRKRLQDHDELKQQYKVFPPITAGDES